MLGHPRFAAELAFYYLPLRKREKVRRLSFLAICLDFGCQELELGEFGTWGFINILANKSLFEL